MRFSALLLCVVAFWFLTPYAIVAILGPSKIRGIIMVIMAAMLFALCLMVDRDIGVHTHCAQSTLPLRGALFYLSMRAAYLCGLVCFRSRMFRPDANGFR